MTAPTPIVASPEDAARGRIRAFAVAMALVLQLPYSLVIFYIAPHLEVGVMMGASFVATLVAAGLILRGRSRGAVWVISLLLVADIAFATWVFGVASGNFLWFFPQLSGSFMVSRTGESARRISSWIWCIAATVFFFGFGPEPLHPLSHSATQVLFWVNAATASLAVVAIGAYGSRVLEGMSRQLTEERARSERLLRNMLPERIAERLKQEPRAIADSFESVSVLFADIAGFTPMSAKMSAREVVGLLNEVFSKFDELARRNGLEKIKTIGDAYMVVGGAPDPRGDHASSAARMALEMRGAIGEVGARGLSLRIGLHLGPAVAGVIGTSKYSYDCGATR